METSFKPVNIVDTPSNPNSNGDSSYSYENRGGDSGMGFFQTMLVAVTVLLFLAAVAIFVWRASLNSGIDGKRKLLETKQEEIGNMQLEGNGKISTKFHTAKILIDSHPFVNDIFKVLEHSVEAGVVYNKFETHTDTVSGNYYVDISGTAPNYKTLIQQIDILKTEYTKYFLSTEVGDFKPNGKGNIDFSLKIKSNIAISPVDLGVELSKIEASRVTDIETIATTTTIASSTEPLSVDDTLAPPVKQNIKPVTKVQSKTKTVNVSDTSGI